MSSNHHALYRKAKSLRRASRPRYQDYRESFKIISTEKVVKAIKEWRERIANASRGQ